MNPAIGAYIGVSKQTEMLLMTVLALWVNIFDMAIFEISSNLDQVWNVEIDKEIFNPHAEYVIRMLLSGVVLIRTFTLHLYIAFLIAVFWPVCFGTRPTLMLPWLVVSAIKNLGTGLVSIATGGYTCIIYGPLRPACLRFLLSQLIDLSPSFYMWFVGLSLYCDLKKPKSVNILQVKAMEDQELNVALRRRKVKSMIDEDILRQQFESRSFQKKFLGTSAVEVNEFINRCSYDNLKNKFSRSLDSLLDVLTVQTELLEIEDSEPLDIDSSSTLQQKTAKLLGISMDEIECIKQNRQTRTDFPVYPVQPQKKIQNISLINSRYESPAKLLPETSLYSPPNIKPIRVTKSELKSAKDFPKMESEFIQSVHEKVTLVHDLTQDVSFESLTNMQMVYQSNNPLFKKPDKNIVTADAETTNISSKIILDSTNENGREYFNNRDRGKLEDVNIEFPTKFKFSNTMSDKSHCLLDEHSFLFDKDTMLMKTVPSKIVSVYAKRNRWNDQNLVDEKQRHLNAPTVDVVATQTRFKDNVINKTPNISENKNNNNNNNNKPNLSKTKEDVINKKISKQSEKIQTTKKKIATREIPSSNYSSIPVSHRNAKSKNGYFNLEKNKIAAHKREDIFNKKKRNSVSHDNKLYTIEENKDIDSVVSGHEEKSTYITVNKVTERIKLINNIEKNSTPELHQEECNQNNKKKLLKEEKEKEEKTKNINIFTTNDEEKNNNKNTLLKEEKNNKLITNEEEKKPSSTLNQEEKNNIKNTLLNEKNLIAKSEESKISVSAENISSASKKDLIKNVKNINNNNNNTLTLNEIEIINKRNYLRSMEFGVPVTYKHSPLKITPPQKGAIKQEQKALEKEENKYNAKVKTSQFHSEKILQMLREKSQLKTDKISVDDIIKAKINKTETINTVNNNNNKFEFSAKIKDTNVSLPVKSSRNKQLEFHFKEKITKSKDNKIEDLFKKKVVADRKESKTSDKDKLGFPSYFSNKINRMITDACQIRKKSCKKINLFVKVPTISNSKQRNKLSTVELFRKQSPSKTDLFDINRKLSIRKLEIPSYKGDKCKDSGTKLNKNNQVPKKVEINLFNMEEVKNKNQPVNLFGNQKTSTISTLKASSKTSVHSTDKTINVTDDIQTVPKENNIFPEDMCIKNSLVNSFMSFKPSVINYGDNQKIDEPICLPKIKPSLETYTNTKESQSSLSSDITNCTKKTESPLKINIFNQTSNSSTAVQKTNSYKKLSDQAMSKMISFTKTNSSKPNELNINLTNTRCKKLSEQAVDKIISLTNSGYPNLFNKELETYVTDRKLNESTAHGSCRKLSDFAIKKLLAITSPKNTLQTKTNTAESEPSFLIFSKINTENQKELFKEKPVSLSVKHSGIPINITRSEISTISDRPDSNLGNKALRTIQSDKSNSLHLNEIHQIAASLPLNSPRVSKTKVNRKSSIPVIKEDSASSLKSLKIKSSLTIIDSTKREIKPLIEEELSDLASDMKLNKSRIIALVEGAINTKSVFTIKENSKNTSAPSVKLTTLNESNPKHIENTSSPVQNQNIPDTITEEENCVESLNKSKSSNEIMSTTKVDNNYKWMYDDCVHIFVSNIQPKEIASTSEENQNISKTEDEYVCKETLPENEMSPNDCSETEDNPNVPHDEISSFEIKEKEKGTSRHSIEPVDSAKNEYGGILNSHCEEEIIDTILINKEEMVSSEIPSNNRVSVEEKKSEKEEELLETKKEKINSKTILTPSISTKNDKNYKGFPPDINNEYQANIPIVKIERECKGTSQHRIQLISSTDLNFDKKLEKIDKPINTKNTNVIKIRHERKGSLKNNNILLSSLLYEAANNSNVPLKEEKVIRGTSQHNIKLISSIKQESSSESNLCRNEKTPYHTVDDLYIPLKQQKVCRGSSQNYIKLISLNKNEFASNPNHSHKEALSNILKEYQTVPIMKEEKVCKATSKHKVKLVSSYKKDSPNKINLFHTETEYETNKNENITIIREEKNCEGTLQHSIKLISSSKHDSPNKTIFIVKEQLPKTKDIIPTSNEDNVQKISNSRPSTHTNLFVNVNTVNGKQNLTVIQKQNDDKDSTKHEVNLFIKDKMINTDETNKCNTEENNHMETFRKITLISNTIQDILETNTKNLIEKSDNNLEFTKMENNVHPLDDRKSSEILSSLIHNVETSIKLQESKKEYLNGGKPSVEISKSKASNKYHSNQIDFGCQTSTLSKKYLDNNPNEFTRKLTRSKSLLKSNSAKSYQDLNLQKNAFASTTTNKSCNCKLETKSNNEDFPKDEKKDSTINLSSRSSRNASYISIHKERLEKAKSSESNLNKSRMLQNCTFLEDGYARLYNLLGVNQHNIDIKSREKINSSLNF